MKSDELRPSHRPSPVAVRTDDRGRPTAVRPKPRGGGSRSPGPSSRRAGGRLLKVVQVREVWRIDDEWWRSPVRRLYFEVVLENGRCTVLYRDLAEGGWYRQKG